MRSGISTLPLHGGQCPAWLFVHMKAMTAAIVEVIIEESGVEEVLRRLSDPFWFQALGCVAGFDWHSSGVTTTVCGALKEGLKDIGPEAGLFIAGGKGATSRKTPQEISATAERHGLAVDPGALIYASRMSAKVDSAAVQDGYQLYHHTFVFTRQGRWAVIQQGMNDQAGMARRYHWLEENMAAYATEPQAAICCDHHHSVLNLVGLDNSAIQDACVSLSGERPEKTQMELLRIMSSQPHLHLQHQHSIPRTAYLDRALRGAYEAQAGDFEALLSVEGLGAGTLRALCLVAEVAYGMAPSFRDPARYAFAHGGKDGYPFPVNEADIETSYRVLQRALRKARAGQGDRVQALKRLALWHSETVIADTRPYTQLHREPPSAGTQARPGEQPALQQDCLF